jgi:hypothetical protein
MDWLDERRLLSAHVVAHFDQGAPVPAGARRLAAHVAVAIPAQEPAPSGGVAKALSPVLSHKAGAPSSATSGGASSTINLPAGSTAAIVSSITQVSPNLFARALTTTVPPAAGAPPTAQSTVTPFGSNAAPGLARSFGQSLQVSLEQVPGSPHAGQEVDLRDSEAAGLPIDETEEAEPFVKNNEKPNATAPTHAPEERLEPAPEPNPLPILLDKILKRAVDADYSLLTTVFGAGSSRSERAPKKPDSSPGFWAILGSAILSAVYVARHTRSSILNPTLRSNETIRNINHEL